MQAFSLVTLLIVTYWALQALGHRQLSFWLMAGFAVLPHAVPIWGHNQLEWYELFGAQAELIGERMLARDAALFLASLAGLVMLHRIISLRDLERRMTFQGISTTDKSQVLKYEGLLLVGLLAAGLSLALLTVLVATLLGRYDAFLDGLHLGRRRHWRGRVGIAGAYPAALASRPVAGHGRINAASLPPTPCAGALPLGTLPAWHILMESLSCSRCSRLPNDNQRITKGESPNSLPHGQLSGQIRS